MNKYVYLCVVVILLLVTVNSAFATTLNVPADHTTIQAAIDAAVTGDEILVADGLYNENVNLNKAISLVSVNGPTATTIQGSAAQSIAVGGGNTGTLCLSVDGITIGTGAGDGFTIVGYDWAAPAIEHAAIYIKGSVHGDLSIVGNDLVADGEAALIAEYGCITGGNVEIAFNEFSGQTYVGSTIGGDSSVQWTVHNVPRSMIYFGGNNIDIHFHHNTVNGSVGGVIEGTSDTYYNTGATIDCKGAGSLTDGAVLDNNTFTIPSWASLRARGFYSTVTNNDFDASISGMYVGAYYENAATGLFANNQRSMFPGMTIQQAIDSSYPGDVINIPPGTYEEQLLIATNDLALVGAGDGDNPSVDTIVLSPISLVWSFSTGANDNYPVIGLNNVSGVAIESLRLDGGGRGTGNYRFTGLGIYNSSASIKDLSVVGIIETPFSGNQHGIGIYAFADDGGPWVDSFFDVMIEDFQKNGMSVVGDGLTASIEQVTVTGIGMTDVIAQNGIQVSHGALGTVTGCTVSDIGYTPATWGATAYLFTSDANVDIDTSFCSNSQFGVLFQETGGSADVVTIDAGSVASACGISLRDYGSFKEGGNHTCIPTSPFDADLIYKGAKDRASSTIDITNCVLTGLGEAGTYGIDAWGMGDADDTIFATVSGCTVTNWEIGVLAYEISSPVVMDCFDCTLVGNDLDAYAETAVAQDFSPNWWGDTDPSDQVYGNILYYPCWSDASMTTLFYPTANIVFVPDTQLISLADDIGGGIYSAEVVCKYHGLGSGPVYGYSIDVTWDPGVVSASSSDFERPDNGLFSTAALFMVTDITGGVRIDAAIGGAVPGIEVGDLFKANLTGAGCGTTELEFTLNNFRDHLNQMLTGFTSDNGEVQVDLAAPIITNEALVRTNLPHNGYAKDGDDLEITADFSDACAGFGGLTITADLSDLLEAGGTDVTPTATSDPAATWTLTAVDLTAPDGVKTVTLKAVDLLGNEVTAIVTIIVDNTPPAAVTGITCAPHHWEVEVGWTHDTTDVDHYWIYRGMWYDTNPGITAYPEYGHLPGSTIPARPPTGLPDPGQGWVRVDGDAITPPVESFFDVFIDFAPLDPPRGVYYYEVYAVDIAGNPSPPAAANDRATNYWLGDVNLPTYNGEVDGNDIAALGLSYYAPYAGGPPYNQECDVAQLGAPVGGFGIPAPDHSVDFEDLMIFALNYSVVMPVLGDQPFTQSQITGQVALDINIPTKPVLGEEFTASVFLSDENSIVQGARFIVGFDTQVLELVDTAPGTLVTASETSFFIAPEVDGQPDINVAVLGRGDTFGGSGELALIRLRMIGEGDVQLELRDLSVRNALNEEVYAGTSSDIDDEVIAQTPATMFLRNASPNPFGSSTQITFGLPAAVDVRLVIFDLSGRLVRKLVDGTMPAGEHHIEWNRLNDSGTVASSGLYFYRITANGKSFTKRMVISD